MVIFFFSAINFKISTIYAVNSTPSAKVQDKLEELKKEIASKSASIASQLKSAVGQKLSDKIYYGQVITIETNHIYIQDSASETKVIKTGQDTKIDKNIKEKSFIVALGDIDDTKSLVAKKVTASKTPRNINYLWGKVISAKENRRNDITIKNAEKKDIDVSLPKDAKVKINDILILTGNTNKEGIFEADFVYVDKKP
jgi:hypothetical protein